MPVPIYLDLARQKRYEEAYRVIQAENPLVLACGRVCNHPCEDLCNRVKIDEPIAINGVKRFVTDVLLEQNGALPVPEVAPSNRIKIAVIGSGPSGLLCVFLQKKGYSVTVFEETPKIGGYARSWTSRVPPSTGEVREGTRCLQEHGRQV